MATTVLTSSDAAWAWPTGVTTLTAEAIGGGGAGGNATNNPATGGGGKGGSYARVTITKGAESTLNITVGGAAQASTIVQGATTVLSAAGGANGVTNSTAGATALVGSNIGTVTYAGGNGGTGVSGGTSGAGGGAAGPSSAGGNASGGTAGGAGTGTFQDSATRQGGGAGGVAVRTAGGVGFNYGGGGSGGSTNQTTDRLGGAGAPGVVVLTYDLPGASTLTEDFSSALDTNKWSTTATAGSGSVSITDGKVEMTYTATAAGSQSRIYSTQPRYTLVGGGAYITVDQALRTSGNAGGIESAFILENFDFTGDYVGFVWYSDGPLYAYSATDYSDASPTLIASDFSTNDATLATHKRLRIKSEGGNFIWQTAPSTSSNPPQESDWVTRRTMASGSAGAPMTECRYVIGTYMGNTAAGVPTQALRLDGLNTAATVTDPTASLSGLGATAAGGTLATNAAVALTCLSAATARGSLSYAYWAGLTGYGLTVARGAFGVTMDRALTGLAGAASGGTLTTTIAGSGAELLDQNGSIITDHVGSALLDAGDGSSAAALSGLAVTASRGTLGVTVSAADKEVELTGQGASTTLGSVGTFLTYTTALTGLAASASQGSVGVASGPVLQGLAATASRGALTPAVQVPLTGLAMPMAQESVESDVVHELTGREVRVEVTSPQPGSATSLTLSGSVLVAAGGSLAPATVCALTGGGASLSHGTLTALRILTVPLSGLALAAARGELGLEGSTPTVDGPPPPFLSIEARINRAVFARLANADAVLAGNIVRGIFENAYAHGDVGMAGMSGTQPVFTMPTASISGEPVGQTVAVNSQTYLVAAHEPDGTGVSRLILERA